MMELFCCGPEPDSPTSVIDESKLIVVEAPAGKLGLGFQMSPCDTFSHVKFVRPESAVADSIKIGDVFVYVNGQDTSKFSHQEITNLMIEKQDEPRTIKIKRD